MNYKLIKDILSLAEKFDSESNPGLYPKDIDGFKKWLCNEQSPTQNLEIYPQHWEGKENGRSPESVISTLLVHLNRYAKTYSKSAIANSDFRTQEEFIYLINLKSFGCMTKMELIKKNVQEKSAGILIINRLILHGWIEQINSERDKRSKVLKITPKGIELLEKQMSKIRTATKIVAGNLNATEKIELIRLLDKLEQFHQPIFMRNIETSKLLDTICNEYEL